MTGTKTLLFHELIHVDKHTSKKNRKRIMRRGGKSFIGSDKSTSAEHKALVLNLMSAKNKQLDAPIDEPIELKAIFWYPDTKAGKRWKKIIDLSNLLQGPEDALTEAGVIVDDSLICSYDGSRRVFGAPRFMLELSIYSFNEDQQWKQQQ